MTNTSSNVQFKSVFLRRGIEIEEKYPVQALVRGIEKGELLVIDQISSDGENWINLGQHKQLAKFFSKNNNDLEKNLNVSPANDKLAVWFIRIAYTLALNTSFLTLITLVPKNPIHIFDVLLSCGLSIGIYNRSLFCAITMLAYFLLSKGIQVFNTSTFNPNEIIIASVLLIGYILGILGILRIEKKERQASL
ncbi:MAG: hypothetical protein H8E32_13920 [Nitrospinae bacterium]|nr:hypothetical protein [Nitrospinota bacterium]